MSNKIKVLIVDDSALVRQTLSDILSSDPGIEVIGMAQDPIVAVQKIAEQVPDVITLDVEMPRMDGLVFLEKLMRLRPMPVLMVSSLTEKSSYITLHAMELGAIDFVTKPKIDISSGINEYAQEITDKIRVAARARVRQPPPHVHLSVERKNTADAVLPVEHRTFSSTEKVIVIGASTGGTEALKSFLVAMPRTPPDPRHPAHARDLHPHLRPAAEQLCRISVKEAETARDPPGHAYIAPGNRHLLLARSGANYMAEISDGPPVSRHRPSVDVLFRSAANRAGKNAIGII